MRVPGTRTTPELSIVDGVFYVVGESLPENAPSFYTPLFEYVNNNNFIEIHFQYSYFNTATAKTLIEVFGTLEALYAGGVNVKVVWESVFGDDDIEYMGVDLLDGYLFPWETKV